MLCEAGAAQQLGTLIAQQMTVARVMIITDPGIVAAGLLEGPIKSLEAANMHVTIFDQTIADPPQEMVLRVADLVKDAKAQLVIGLGGGSSMDTAKLAAVLALSDQALEDMYGVDKVVGPRLPLVLIPTTAGTGSEVTAVSIVTTGATSKMGVVSPHLYADLAILDAQLTVGLPSQITAATGIDAMVHAIEAYTSKHKKNAISDMLAQKALVLLVNNMVSACEDGNNIEARSAMLLGAMLAGQAFANAPVAAVHALAYPLGGLFHIPHGLSNALMLSPVMRFNAPAAAQHYAELADLLLPDIHGSAMEKTIALIEFLEEIMEKIHLQRRLSQLGITQTDIATLAEHAMLQTRLLVNNPRALLLDDAISLYSQAL
ncbi:MAG: iron-containing alcohol dehydrogenase [Spongiibacteraceae bacterium]|nr:iron-containing alcohol dehydrogenase [Spongiibacteraceae bacterium]